MKNVSTEMVKQISEEIKKMSTNLGDVYSSITSDISAINECIASLKSYNNQDASEILTETKLVDMKIADVPVENYYKYIWEIDISGEYTVTNALSNSGISSLEDDINTLHLSTENLLLLSTTIANFISIIESELGVNYDNNIIDFFNNVKGTDGWSEYKKISQEAVYAKSVDELYKKYRSNTGNPDYVDFLLDELGNRRLAEGVGLDAGTQYDRGISKYGQWYVNFDSQSGMTNDAAYCAAAVSYAANESGNGNKFPNYISVDRGSISAQQEASNGNGAWHYSSDTSYTPKRGDIFYQCSAASDGSSTSHTGIVLDSVGSNIYTIEGNTASEARGQYSATSFGTVNTRIRNSTYINNGNQNSGYYTPNIPINNSSSANVSISQKTLDIKNELNGNNN